MSRDDSSQERRPPEPCAEVRILPRAQKGDEPQRAQVAPKLTALAFDPARVGFTWRGR
jgi:hypothetical protein